MGYLSNLSTGKSFLIGSSAGSKANFEGTEFELGTWQKQKVPTNGPSFYGGGGYPGYPGQGGWNVVVGTGDKDESRSWRLVAYGEDAKPIPYVDTKGRPLTEAEFNKLLQEAQKPGKISPPGLGYSRSGFPFPQPAASQAFTSTSGARVPGAFTLNSNIDPRYIAKLEFKGLKSLRIKIDGFPLDPR